MSSSVAESSVSKKRAAVSSSKTDEEASASKLRRLADEEGLDAGANFGGEDQSKPSADPHHDLDLAFRRRSQAQADIEAAQQRLKGCLADIEKARHNIRSRGEAEVDSLLVIGNDSISHLLTFFGVKELCRLEMVCAAFKRRSSDAWKALDKAMGEHNRSMSNCPKTRCVRYVRGSEYAQKMERLAGSHRWEEYRRFHQNPHDFETTSQLSDLDFCDKFKEDAAGHHWSNETVTCDFPDSMARVGSPDKELFIQIRAEGWILLEGIFPLRRLSDYACLDLSQAKCPRWAAMEKLLSLRGNDQCNTKNESMWNSNAITVATKLEAYAIVTLVSFSKGHEPHLVAAIDDFQELRDDLLERSWVTRVAGLTPMTPHEAEAQPEALKIEFGWTSTKDMIGFCLSDTEVYF